MFTPKRILFKSRKRNMKLCRIGSVGEEKPAIIDSEKITETCHQ